MGFKETFYLSHGSPAISTDDTLPARHFLQSWKGEVLKEKPKAILVISAHWDTKYPAVNVVQRNETIYDFYGFPDIMYQLKYPAPAAPDLAKRVKELLLGAGFKHVDEDKKRGLDHGAWTPPMLMYPEADIPVCQLSVQSHLDGTHHYNMGKALTPLKEEGILVVGSGSATHNLRALRYGGKFFAPWATEFDSWLKDALLDGRQCLVKVAHRQTNNWVEALLCCHMSMGKLHCCTVFVTTSPTPWNRRSLGVKLRVRWVHLAPPGTGFPRLPLHPPVQLAHNNKELSLNHWPKRLSHLLMVVA